MHSFFSTHPDLQRPISSIRQVNLPNVSGVGTGTVFHHVAALWSQVYIHRGSQQPLRTVTLQDTGASLSLIAVRLLTDEQCAKIKPRSQKVSGIGSKESLGFIVLDISLPANDIDDIPLSLNIQHEFWVMPELAVGMLIGLDWLGPQGVQLNLDSLLAILPNGTSYPVYAHRHGPESFLTSSSETGELLVNYAFTELDADGFPSAAAFDDHEDTNDQQRQLYSVESKTIPPGHGMWIKTSMHKMRYAEGYSTTALVQADVWTEPDRDVWLLIPSAICTPATPYIFVANHGTYPAPIEPGQPLALATFLTNDEHAAMCRLDDTIRRPQMDDHPEVYAVDTQPLDPKDDPGIYDIPDPSRLNNRTVLHDHFDVGVNEHGQPDAQLSALLKEYIDIFSLDGTPGHVKEPKMSIPLKPDAQLRAHPPRRASPEKRKIIEQTVKQLLEWDIIQPSNSSTSYPVLLVAQNGKHRFCVDYRPLNLATVDDKYPLQRIDDMLDALSGSKLFSTLDAVKGYHQMEVVENDRWKTAFACHLGLFEYKRVPFGLKGAPAFFQRFMDSMLGSLRWTSALVYLDDIVIYSKTTQEHIISLRTLFASARKVGLKFDPKKCHFMLQSIKLLGKMVCAKGVSILPDRALAIRQLSPPVNLEQLQSQIGLFNWYRAHIPRFSEYADKIITHMEGIRYDRLANGIVRFFDLQNRGKTAKLCLIQFTKEQLDAFNQLKLKLADSVQLAHPMYDRPFILYLDSSQTRQAAALHQQLIVPVASVAGATLTAEFLPVPLTVDTIRNAQAADPLWKKIYQDLADGLDRDVYMLDQDKLLRVRANQRLCLPSSLTMQVFEASHQLHFGYYRTYLQLSEHWFHPRLAEFTRKFVTGCPECVRVNIARRTGFIDPNQPTPMSPFEEISADVVKMPPTTLPHSKITCDGLLVVLDTFSKAVALRPIPFAATSSEIADNVFDCVVRQGWKPQRIITDSDHRMTGSHMKELAERIGAAITPSPPYHQQANPVERYIQTLVKVFTKLLLDKRHSDWSRLVPVVELLMNSTPNTSTKFAPFDLLFIHRPSFVHHHSFLDHHLTMQDKAHLSMEKIARAREELRLARDQQSRSYAKRRRPPPVYKVGDLVMIKTGERPLIHHQLSSKFTPLLDGPYRITEVLSPHRVKLELDDSMTGSNEYSTEQIQLVPTDDDYGRPGLRPEQAGEDEGWEPAYITEERIYRKKLQYKVKWVGSNKLTWIDATRLQQEGCTDVIEDWKQLQVQTSHVLTAQPPTIPLHDTAALALDHPIKRPKIVTYEGVQYRITEHPVAFSSNETPKKYQHCLGAELEAAGFIWAWQKFKTYLEGSRVIVVTDHMPLTSFLSSSSSNVEYGPVIAAARALIMPYIHLFTFVHRAGSEHTNVDALSRLPVTDIDDHDDSSSPNISDTSTSSQ